MNPSRKVVIITIASSALLGTGLLSQGAFAQASNNSSPSLADEIASKFNLSPSEVQAVLDQHKQEKQTTKSQKYEDKLNQAVSQGSLTPAEESLVLAKRTEITQKLNQIRTIQNAADRKAALKQLQIDLSTWSNQNSIALKWLRFRK